MEYGLTVITPPASEPISLTLAKAFLKIDHAAEDTLLTGLIVAARQLTESYTGRRWITQTLRLTLAEFPCWEIRLPVLPVASITAITYKDVAGVTQTLSPSLYQTWLDHNPPLIAPAVNQYWPYTRTQAIQAVTVDFVAGAASADVPEQVKAAILLTIGNWDANRGDQNILIARGLPPNARFLLDQLWTGAYS